MAAAERDYQQQAADFLARFGMGIHIRHAQAKQWGWHDDEDSITRHYVVTLRRDRKSIRFDFWGSIYDEQAGKDPTPYDILACLSSDVSGSADPDEVADEFGTMKTSQAIAAARFAKRLQAFFTEQEIEALQEIQ